MFFNGLIAGVGKWYAETGRVENGFSETILPEMYRGKWFPRDT
jgi:hypothetical protein